MPLRRGNVQGRDTTGVNPAMRPNHTPACVTAYLTALEDRLYARIWRQITKTDGCWLWTGGVDEFGYGRTRVGRTAPRVHRLTYEMEYGPIPDGALVCHRCDVPACVRPSHLWLGSKSENNADRDAKGRGRIALQGEANPKAKLTVADVQSIRRRWTGAYGQAEALRREYGIGAPALYAVVRRTGWTHVPDHY